MTINHDWMRPYLAEYTAARMVWPGFIASPDTSNVSRFAGAIMVYELRESKHHDGRDFLCACIVSDGRDGHNVEIVSLSGMHWGMVQRNDDFVVLHQCTYALYMTDPADKWRLLRITRPAYTQYGVDAGWWQS